MSEGKQVERTEYRVISEEGESAVLFDPTGARYLAEDRRAAGCDATLQTRTVTETPWEDVPDA